MGVIVIHKSLNTHGMMYYNNFMAARSSKSPAKSQPRKQARKPGRPKLPKGEAKGNIVPIRVTGDTLKRITQAAKASEQTLSEWIRSALLAAIKSDDRLRSRVKGTDK
jgi:hypothetical protein